MSPTTCSAIAIDEVAPGVGALRMSGKLFVTHLIALSLHIADNLAVLNKGKIVDYVPTAWVLEDTTHECTRSLVSDVPKF